MKKFHFTLRSVQTVRSIRELRAREAFSASVLAHASAARALELAREEVRQMEAILVSERGHLFKGAEQASYLSECERLRGCEKTAAQDLLDAAKTMDNCREQWITTRRDVRVIENLEHKARDNYRRECEHEEQAQLDDRVNALVGKAPLLSP